MQRHRPRVRQPGPLVRREAREHPGPGFAEVHHGCRGFRLSLDGTRLDGTGLNGPRLDRPLLDRLGLAAAIESLVQHVSRSTSISLSTHLDQIEGMLSAEVETSLYRIVQEGIHNIIKHSNATSARIEIRKKGNQLIVLIQDNGIGIPAGKSAADGNKTVGLGLAGIAERVRGFGGSFEIESESQRGTMLMIRLETDSVATE